LLKSEKTKKRGIRGKQNNASWDHAYLPQIFGNLDAVALWRFPGCLVSLKVVI